MRIGMVSDAHGCVEAFDYALSILDRLNVENVYFLGDAIGYFPGLNVVDRLMDAGIPAVLGNHELMALEGTYHEREQIYRLGETMSLAEDRHWDYLKRLPEIVSFEGGCGRIDLMHGAPCSPVSGYLYPDADFASVDSGGAAVVCMGHTHRPMVISAGGYNYVNVGSCAMPRDGGMLGSVCVLDSDEGLAELFRYDVSDAFRRAALRCGAIHQTVMDLLDRPSDGEIVGTLMR